MNNDARLRDSVMDNNERQFYFFGRLCRPVLGNARGLYCRVGREGSDDDRDGIDG